ncbi:MAG TPA: RNA polymerase sigma factor [Polyangiaceae bacterium]
MDSALLEAFRRGDRNALERVYRLTIDEVERFVGARLARAGRFSGANLADLVQDVYLRAFSASARAGYDGERDYLPYLLTLARNVLIDWLRRGARELVDARAIEALVDPTARDPSEAELFEPELVSAAQRYVERLPPELRNVHEQRFIRAEPQKSAAQALGVSRQNLRTLERRLVDGLRRELRRAELADGGVTFHQPKRRSSA